MTFQEDGVIIYPYVTNNQLIYEVDYAGSIRQEVHELPEPTSGRWECFGAEVDWGNNTSEVVVDIVDY